MRFFFEAFEYQICNFFVFCEDFIGRGFTRIRHKNGLKNPRLSAQIRVPFFGCGHGLRYGLRGSVSGILLQTLSTFQRGSG